MKKFNKGFLQAGIITGIASLFVAVLLISKLNSIASVKNSEALPAPERCGSSSDGWDCGTYGEHQGSPYCDKLC